MNSCLTFPFDGAADAGILLLGADADFCDLLHGLEQIAAGVGGGGLLARGVELAAILQLQIGVEAEKIGRADCAVGLGHGLRFVMQVGKTEAVLRGEQLHIVEGVFGIGAHVVAVDGHRMHAQGAQLPGIAHHAVGHGLHIRAVIADEHHQQSLGAAQFGQGMAASVDAGQVEIGRGKSALQGIGGCGHDKTPLLGCRGMQCTDDNPG